MNGELFDELNSDANGFDGVFPVLVLPNGVFKNILASPSLKGPSPKRFSASCLLLLLPNDIGFFS